MIRHAPTLIAFLVASTFACDKPGVTERQGEKQANEPLTQAGDETAERTQGAQTPAARDDAGARTDFERNREDYLRARAADLTDLDKKVAALETKEKMAQDRAKSALQADLSAIRAKRDAFVRDLNALGNATAAAWDEAKAKLEREWNALKTAVDKDQ
jgi:hypothetical protein